jgi:hypothetical protein
MTHRCPGPIPPPPIPPKVRNLLEKVMKNSHARGLRDGSESVTKALSELFVRILPEDTSTLTREGILSIVRAAGEMSKTAIERIRVAND